MQLNFDAQFFIFLIWGTIFMIGQHQNGWQYDLGDLLFANCGYLGTTSALIFLTLGLKYGYAGIVQAVENLKVTWHTLLIMALTQGQKMPNGSQFFGMACGVIGGILIVLYKPKPKPIVVQRYSLLDQQRKNYSKLLFTLPNTPRKNIEE
jgi:uncharacterized membrane protein